MGTGAALFPGQPRCSPAPAPTVRPQLRQRCPGLPPCPVSRPGVRAVPWLPASPPGGAQPGGFSQPRPPALLLFVPARSSPRKAPHPQCPLPGGVCTPRGAFPRVLPPPVTHSGGKTPPKSEGVPRIPPGAVPAVRAPTGAGGSGEVPRAAPAADGHPPTRERGRAEPGASPSLPVAAPPRSRPALRSPGRARRSALAARRGRGGPWPARSIAPGRRAEPRGPEGGPGTRSGASGSRRGAGAMSGAR